jgi:hypothetical protein
MASAYDNAFAELYRAPFDKFVVERKRLAAALKASGDSASAARLSAVTRPPVSAWAVNQLFWQDRKTFDELFETAERLRDAALDPRATDAHREVITKLRNRAEKLLTGAGKSAGESTLRRVTSTLTALAAIGSFDPDSPGALKGDRDPPGFDVAGLMASLPAKRKPGNSGEKPKAAETKRREKAEAVAERKRLERERKNEKVERERLERKLRIAQGVLEARKEEILRLKEKLAEAEDSVEGARAVVREAEKLLVELDRVTRA